MRTISGTAAAALLRPLGAGAHVLLLDVAQTGPSAPWVATWAWRTAEDWLVWSTKEQLFAPTHGAAVATLLAPNWARYRRESACDGGHPVRREWQRMEISRKISEYQEKILALKASYESLL